MGYQIAIDGPSGSGKSTLAKNLSKELGFIYVDTGAMYRAVGLYFLRNNISFDTNEVSEILKNVAINLEYINGTQHIFLNKEDVTSAIRTQEGADSASKVAAIPEVRKVLVSLQQKIAEDKNVVMDGRDIGTFVLKNADIKIYLDASSEIRAERRIGELSEKGITADFKTVKKEIEERDFRDMNRSTTPLKKADDAIYINSDKLNEDELLKIILDLYNKP